MAVRGSVVYLYAFDVGSEVLMARLGPGFVRPDAPLASPRKPAVPKEISFPRPAVVDPIKSIAVDGRSVQVEIRVYEIGVITVAVQIAYSIDDILGLRKFHQPIVSDGMLLDTLVREMCREVFKQLGDAVRNPTPVGEPEAYTVFCLTDIGGEANACHWLDAHKSEVAGLLSDTESCGVSESQVTETLRHRQSFSPGDVVVLDWDAALVIDLTGRVEDVLYVLELANLQLLELRVLDATLDQHLGRAYDHLGRPTGLWPGRWARVLREIRQLRVDVAQLADAVTNITKFVGDWYLARVYLSARERFHLEDWRSSVEGRLGQLDRLYGVIHTDVTERRMFVLEVLITVFVGYEVFAAIFGLK